ncbi:hypothetical protein MDAP_001723 [Mitosporidium daphniae]|uniref:PH domain-containing protein n=1 Tax=Mitosporidium daphniae TaxID=1485682 RepID=A0A098VW42_9MICR|nr:uncharacterized protein DI09_10p370 [Mitosporidium daphniae]KGG53140.1 hypothetical protein DI09_10p370 [Mitosporidium daphniae]|eukprot:XP_013239567.1 uncharacterized protein DI09_10p370 [Mitosporidium daphniae]
MLTKKEAKQPFGAKNSPNESSSSLACHSPFAATTFFDGINKGIVILPDDIHLHTVVCPSTGTSTLPRLDSTEASPFYSWVKMALGAAPPAPGTPPKHTLAQIDTYPQEKHAPDADIDEFFYGRSKDASPKHHTTPVMFMQERNNSIPTVNTAAAKALGCSAVLLHLCSFEDGAKEPRILVFQVRDAQLRSCRIPSGKKRGSPRAISEAFLFPTLEESIDIHVSLAAVTSSPGMCEDFSSSRSIHSSMKSSTGSSLGKAKAILDSVLFKSSFSSLSPKSLLMKGRRGSTIFDRMDGSKTPESPILNARRKEEPFIASTIFRVDLVSAAHSKLPQWFELILPMAGASGVARLVLSVSALYAPTPSKSKWRSRPTSLLSLINLQEHNGIPAHADYLTLLQRNSSPMKVSTWRRFWAVVAAGRILLYPYQQKEAVLPLLTIELTNIIGVKAADPERLHQRNAFHLISDSGVRHSLYADSEASLKKWMAICAVGHSSNATTELPLLFNNIKTAPALPTC